MLQINQIKLHPDEGEKALRAAAGRALRVSPDEIHELRILRRAIDARKKPELFYVYNLAVSLRNPSLEKKLLKKNRSRDVFAFRETEYAPGSCAANERGFDENERPVIVGMGPAGLFCALALAEAGLRPVIAERGQCVEKRTQTVGAFWKGGALNVKSNVQFGEGGAGTFSDGKLNTGVKDPAGRIRYILKTFVRFGADPEILYSYKPHVGTDVLAKVVKNIRQRLIELGAEVLFETCLTDITSCADGEWELTFTGSDSHIFTLRSRALVLALGHSARDTFRMLEKNKFIMTPKAFAVGVRVQHPQSLIDRAMYGEGSAYTMPPSPYKLTHRLPDGGGVYSFCMCPGGYIVNAASEEGMLCVNGMSLHDRDSGFANSAIVVTVSPEEIARCMESDLTDPLLCMEFQRRLERAAFEEGGGRIPVQRFEDFRNGRVSDRFGAGNPPAIRGQYTGADVRHILPAFIADGIEEGILSWERQIAGFSDPDTLLAGTENRTSSPVRILRGEDLQAVDHPGIYPCGEGAGYAGGITSAAVDGLRVAEEIVKAWGLSSDRAAGL